MKISYLVTCSTETKTLNNLLSRLDEVLGDNDDEVIILVDNPSKQTVEIVSNWTSGQTNVYGYEHSLNADYGAHKNFGSTKCSGYFIFQIDGDELPSENIIGDNLKAIIESNPEVELIYVPRINDYKGVKEEHARQWGWRLTSSKSDGIAQGRPLVNFPDFQGRIYRNISDRIKWDRKLHEKIEGHKEYSFLPVEEEYALYHDKTIEKQLETNLRYNKVFTVEDNMGHKVV